jgi:hypothetical protein
MRLLDGHLGRACFGSALLAMLMLSGGCRAAGKSLFTASGPGWHVQEGQALWRPGQGYPEVAGEVILASHEDGRCLVQFAKTPMTLVSAQTTPTRWLIEFPPGNIGFSGSRPPAEPTWSHLHSPKDAVSSDKPMGPPTRFLWLHLCAALSGKPLLRPLSFERKPDGGWRIQNVTTGENLEGFLTP